MPQDISPSDKPKIAAARAALALVEPGMRLGLGTGSTAFWLVKFLGEAVRGGLEVNTVPTSSRTRDQALAEGINVTTLDDLKWLDLTIDGADELDRDLMLIKGGGGAHLREKIVATASDRMVVIADPSKEVETLGAFPLPVEITPFGAAVTEGLIADALEDADVAGRQITRRMAGDQRFVSDEGNYILDLHLKAIKAPRVLDLVLRQIPGVIETGLFIDIADRAIIGEADGTARLVELAIA